MLLDKGGGPPTMHQRLNLVLALAAGLSGGVLSRYILPTPVLAQTPAPAPKELRSLSFIVVDDKNNVVGSFKRSVTKPGETPTVVLLVLDGMVVWRGSGAAIRPASQR
jgi:hypothetical protein